MKSFKTFLSFSCGFLTVIINAAAQKLPNKQEVSVYAPLNIKIDGKATEWDNTFKAYNHATEIYYTLANDNNNIYLIVKAENRVIVNKIINGGVTLALGKNDKDVVKITYPVYERNSKPSLSINTKEAMDPGLANSVLLTDSAVSANNRNLNDMSKWVMVTGVKGIDILTSVYNEDGIKTAQRFDNKMAYTYELEVPLKYLNIPTTNEAKVAYHITLNGASIFPNSQLKGAGQTNMPNSDNGIIEAKINAEMIQLGQTTAPTDFSGEYVLAKK